MMLIESKNIAVILSKAGKYHYCKVLSAFSSKQERNPQTPEEA